MFVRSSPHAEMMRKRNNIVFNLVESERDYVHQLEILVANYVRPFRMGKLQRSIVCRNETICSTSCSGQFEEATHHSRRSQFDLSQQVRRSIRSASSLLFSSFLSEIILFLHQIFYKGLSKKLENWPTFYTGKPFVRSSLRS